MLSHLCMRVYFDSINGVKLLYNCQRFFDISMVWTLIMSQYFWQQKWCKYCIQFYVLFRDFEIRHWLFVFEDFFNLEQRNWCDRICSKRALNFHLSGFHLLPERLNTLWFMQKGTRPSEACWRGQIAPNPTQRAVILLLELNGGLNIRVWALFNVLMISDSKSETV